MSPKKSDSKKPSTSRGNARKDVAREVTKKAAQTKTPAAPALKPDQMPADVLEFIQAIDDYKRLEGRPFPSWTEVLEIVKTLGYERRAG